MKTGKLPENIFKRSVLKELNYKRKEIISGAGIGNDCAILSSENENIVTGMVYMVEKADRIGMLAVHRAVNQIAASGAEPVAVTGMVLLTEETSEETLKIIIHQIEQTCKEIGIQAAGINVSVNSGTKVPETGYIMLVMTGIGKMKRRCLPVDQKTGEDFARPEQDVLLTKWVGLEGTYRIAREKENELVKRFSAEYIEEAKRFDRYLSILPEAATAMESSVGAMHHVSEGGIFGALWEMAERSGVGLEIELKRIPIRQETVEICNYYDINPYVLLSSGCLLMTADKGHELVENLHKKGISAAVIGRTTDSNERLIINEEEKRFLTPAQQDEYFKLV
ncbi:MAG: AIR synthase family protein [Lachnospiraceae bacterium]|nr:AIR synthase family protein [Lachnospiraceae bacterium]